MPTSVLLLFCNTRENFPLATGHGWLILVSRNYTMGIKFWIKRFVTVLVGAFVIICAVQVAKGHDFRYAARHAALWGFITAGVFTAARLFQSRRGQHCAICKDTPEIGRDEGNISGRDAS
ncbi:MAG TPA: hypothetical protein VJ719_00465 [Chthoniobacterales bacterium]|nr:hypothetical protein [Chthoniobacterales bacterium]